MTVVRLRRPRWWTRAFDKHDRVITPGFDIEQTEDGPRVALWCGKPDDTSPAYLTLEAIAQHIVNARHAAAVLYEYANRPRR